MHVPLPLSVGQVGNGLLGFANSCRKDISHRLVKLLSPTYRSVGLKELGKCK